MSTRISYIHGPAKANPIPDFWRVRRDAAPPKPSYINFMGMTEGGLRLNLIHEQLKIMNSYYTEDRFFENQLTELDRLMRRPRAQVTGARDKSMEQVRYWWNMAAANNQPAVMFNRPGQTTTIGRISLSEVLGDDFALFYQVMAGQITDKSFILSLYKLLADKYPNDFKYEYKKKKPHFKCISDQCNEWLVDIRKKGTYVDLLNEKLPGSAHHILYNYYNLPGQPPALVAAKINQHRQAIDLWSSISGLSKENLNLWNRNEVMRSNQKQGIEPLQPEDTIQVMATEIPREGDDSVGFLAIVVAILTAVAAAVTATQKLVQSIKNQKDYKKMEASLQAYGLPSFGPEETDWTGLGGPTQPQFNQSGFGLDNNMVLPLLAAGAAFFAIKEMK